MTKANVGKISTLVLWTMVTLSLLASCSGDSSLPDVSQSTLVPSPTQLVIDPLLPQGTATVAPSSTAVVTSTSTQTPAPDLAISNLVRNLNEALKNGNVEFFRTRATTVPVTCSLEDVNLTAGDAGACTKQGEQFDGIDLAFWRSDLQAKFRIDAVLGLIQSLWKTAVPGATDKFGSGLPRVYATGGNGESTVLTALIANPDNSNGPPKRVVLVLHWKPAQGGLVFHQVDKAFVLGEEFLEPTDPARRYLGSWEAVQP